MNTRIIPTALAALSLGFGCIAHTHAQLVILPAPRLLTTMQMGAKAGTTVEVTITGEHIEEAQLQFSYSKVSAVPKRNAEGLVVQNKFVVSIAPDATPQICEARVMTQRGISSSRAFSIHTLDEVVREKPNTTLQTALPLLANSICNATTTTKAVDYYSIQTTKGHRYAIECATSGIDSKLTPVLIVADPAGRDLLVNRLPGWRGEFLPSRDPRTRGVGYRHLSSQNKVSLRSLAPGRAPHTVPPPQRDRTEQHPRAGAENFPPLHY